MNIFLHFAGNDLHISGRLHDPPAFQSPGCPFLLPSHSIISDFFQLSSSRCQYLPMWNRQTRKQRNTITWVNIAIVKHRDCTHRNAIVYGEINFAYSFRLTLYFFVYDYISLCAVCRYTSVQNMIAYEEIRKERGYFILTLNQARKVI
jgi:hypothetical protein